MKKGFISLVVLLLLIAAADAQLLMVFGGHALASNCGSGEIGTFPDCFPEPPAAGSNWEVVFHDEFDGSSLDTGKWTPCFDWNTGGCTDSFNSGKEHYDPAQVQLSGGTAKLVYQPQTPVSDPDCFNNSCTYKGGLLATSREIVGGTYRFPFTYGYIEARIKYPGVSGFFTAVWMLPTDPSFDYDTELDIVEILGGDPDTLWMTYHYNGRTQFHQVNNCAGGDLSGQWVTVGADWQANHVAWYLNGTLCTQYNGSPATIEDGPMQLMLHMMIDNQWERDAGLVLANQSLVDQLEVDYVRIYQQQ